MINALRQMANANFQRCGARCLNSVVNRPKIDDCFTENEPILSYLPDSKERKELEGALKKMSSEVVDVPIVVGGKEIRTKDVRCQVMPHDHQKALARFYYADKEVIQQAINVSVEAQKKWDKVPLEERVAIWRCAGDLMAGKYRQELNAATMLGQSKTVIQAEIDSAAELTDFFRFNAHYAKEAARYQPISTDPGVTLNSSRFRGIDGFFAAISPFNFTAIGGNLAYAPALMGNAVLWKPSDTAILSNYLIFKICKEAGVPDGVVNFVPADGPVFGDAITSSPHLAGINFTGSVPTFSWLWTQVGKNIGKYKNFPRLLGECGGKNFHFIHPSADVKTVVSSTIRAAFEYGGQKCSACSRLYVPESLWPEIKKGLLEIRDQLKIGSPTDYSTFASAVIDDKAFKRIKGYIEHAKKSSALEIIGGGKYDDSQGYFICPTIVETKDPKDKIMTEEIFGPVLTVYVYKDSEIDATLQLLQDTVPFALTGAIFAQDQSFLEKGLDVLKYAAGNFYINDKSTGAVVGQQPFGGGRMSGTNDKPGGPHYVLRFTSPQSIKETFVPMTDWKYPYMS